MHDYICRTNKIIHEDSLEGLDFHGLLFGVIHPCFLLYPHDRTVYYFDNKKVLNPDAIDKVCNYTEWRRVGFS